MKAALVLVNIALGFVVWAPTWLKIYRTRSTKEYSLLSFAIILTMQFISLTVAALDGSAALVWYFVSNGAVVAFTTWLIWKYR
jgi:hypothetical protein